MGPTPAQNRAHETLLETIRSAERDGTTRLPTTARLAEMAGVSYVTMWREVSTVARTGALRCRPNSGIELTGQPVLSAIDSPPVARPQRWQAVRDRLQHDMLAGVLLPGQALPPPKALRRQFGVAHATLRTALAALVGDGSLVPFRRTYKVSSPAAGVPHASVALIGRGDSSGNLHLFYTARVQEFFYGLEQECGRAGVRLDVYPFDETAGRLYGPDGAPVSVKALGRESALGVLIFATGLSAPRLAAMLADLVQVSLPVAVVDETNTAVLRDCVESRHSRVRLFPLAAGASHGAIMGRYLWSLGHRRVAFLSPYQGVAWSESRLEGVRAAFDASGVDAVRAFTMRIGTVSTQMSVRKAVARRAGDAARRIGAWRSDPQPAVMAQTVRALDEAANEAMNVSIPRGEIRELCKQAHACSDITAWVCANDIVAREALLYLDRAGVRVPGELTVVGFDDAERRFRQDLTSYNFNISAIVRAMLGHVLGWRPVQERPGLGAIVELPGFVTSRRTSGPPRAQAL